MELERQKNMLKPLIASPPLETVVQRLDALPGKFAVMLTRATAGAVDSAIVDMLEQIGTVLGVDRAAFSFETASKETLSRGSVRVWNRGRPSPACEAVHNVRVAIEGRPFGALSVGLWQAREPWPAIVEGCLERIAHVMALGIQRAQQSSELDQARREMAGLTSRAVGFDDIADPTEFTDIIGESPALRVAQARVQEVASTDASVVLLGETGTGKELFARAVHSRSSRRDRPFVRVNCAALPQTLIESELFGHERGAFTGAVATRTGRFELAHKGTIFLDEIGDLPSEVQAKLLRVLQEGEFERVGSSQSRKVDVRVVAATHHDLDAEVAEGRFRADLYYRLNVFPISLPPLRDRLEDVPRLVWFFINQRQRALNRRFTKVPSSVMDVLQRRRWPGNVRELQNVIERAMIHSTGDTLWLDEDPCLSTTKAGPRAATLEVVERRYIEEVLRNCAWRINGPGNAAETLGLHPNTLRFRMKKLGLQRPAKSGRVHAFLARDSSAGHV